MKQGKTNRKSWLYFLLGFSYSDRDAGFDLDVEIAKIYNYINESSVKLAVHLAEKSLKEKFAKKLLNYISSISKPLKHIKYFVKNILPTL